MHIYLTLQKYGQPNRPERTRQVESTSFLHAADENWSPSCTNLILNTLYNVIIQLTSAALNKFATSCMGSSSCFCTKDTKASTDRLPLYSLLAGCPFINTFIVGYLVI